MLEQVHHPDLLPDAVAGKVDDDVVAFGDTLLVQLRDDHRARQQVAVVGDEDHRRAVAQRDLEEPRHGAVQDPETILAPLHLEVRLVGEVHRHHVAEEAVGLEDVEGELAVGIPGLVCHHEVDVVLEVAPPLGGAARKPEVHAVVELLVAAIEGAVDVEHPGHALVDVLGGEAEHVIVEPVAAHGLVPVAGDLDDATVVGGAAGPGIGRVGVDGPPPCQDDGIVVVVELAGEEVGPREAVVLGPVVPVVLVDRDRVPSEAPVLGDVERQLVPVAEEDGLAVTDLHQLGRQRPVERPQRQRSLVGQARVEGRS